ncbi:SPL family radical SAM protein [Treponema pedis]|uniref:Radical SAM domain protein n=2 Tax=Treponema pedis TaxID=409322 RepID=S6A8K4_9SPIR|nr:radical SAM protein [Treponema pedis]AGT43984.1 Radical SAM domain protein [Treponema pedis str. T A4]
MHNKIYKSILSAKNGMNIFRGCTHGCIYCDSRSLCYNMRHDFEDIEIKVNATELLKEAIKKKKKSCMIGTGSMSDPYLNSEKDLNIMRSCLQLIYDYGFGISVLTKSDLILRDLDLLKKINKKTKCVVQMTLTTYDEALCKIIEPNVCTTKRRFEVLNILKEEGIPTVVWFTPILPFINDTEENITGILDYCIKAGVFGIIFFGIGLTLREGNREYFYKNLDKSFPGIKEKYIKLYGSSYIVNSPDNTRLSNLFFKICSRNGIVCNNDEIFKFINTFEEKEGCLF